MRRFNPVLAASLAATLVATTADARPTFAANRAGGEMATVKADDPTLMEGIAGFLGFAARVKATPIAGSDRPRGAAPVGDQCEEEKKRADEARAAESRRTAAAERRQRGGEPVYLAF